MRRLPVLLLAALLAACATSTPADSPQAPGAAASMSSAAAPQEFLLDSAARDFRTHPPSPAGFRNVRYGQLAQPDGSASHRLCGEFQVAPAGAAPEWVAFATIKTSGYEQWLGDTRYCSGPIEWSPGDLSAELQRRFDATR